MLYDNSLDSKKAFGSLSMCQRKALQTRFAKEGFYKSTIDGLWGKNTKAAFDRSLTSNKLEQIKEDDLMVAYGLENKCNWQYVKVKANSKSNTVIALWLAAMVSLIF